MNKKETIIVIWRLNLKLLQDRLSLICPEFTTHFKMLEVAKTEFIKVHILM